MPYNDLSKPEFMRFFIENCEKTAKLRSKWHNDNKDLVTPAATFKGNEKGYTDSDVTKSVIEAGMATTIRDNIVGKRYRRQNIVCQEDKLFPTKEDIDKDLIKNINLGNIKEDLNIDHLNNGFARQPVMLPIKLEEKEMIYKGLPEFGRVEYLKARYRAKPEEKFYCEVTRNQEYGWRLNDSFFGKNAPQYPRRGYMNECLLSRSGCQPDPNHYRSPEAILQSLPCSSDKS